MDFLSRIILNIRWQDTLDIALNSYLLFRFYVLFRGTNVLRALFGLACIWFAQKLAISMGFIVSSWISQGITAAAALIVVVIFRNEIRGVLQTKNIKAILWDLPRRSVASPTEIIAESVFEMARKRVGALIVLPGKEDLEENVQHGIPWRAIISKEMILSVFWPDNPVHDGAAIVQGNRITEVGCILPLSKQEDVPSYYGTRHRAALGLAENTDALVIVVSEERGEVTLAGKGRLKRVSSAQDLENHLIDHGGVRLRTRYGLLNPKLEFTAAAVASVLFTLGIWLSITRGVDTLSTFEVPVEYMNRAPYQEIIETSANTLKLQLSGSRSLLKTIDSDRLRVRVDLSKAIVGPNDFAITRDNITLPAGVILKDVQPSVVEVKLDVISEKELAVQADWVGKMADDLIISRAEVTPQKVVVIGASHFLESLNTIYTEKIPVDTLNQSGSITVNLAVNPAKLKLAPGYKNAVTVDYIVKNREP
jgi:uncharacterized protein (TIGR00159 family)